ncbi:MAG: hypothetical protein ACRBDI_03670 [Alphaproteobacteria bacterium]
MSNLRVFLIVFSMLFMFPEQSMAKDSVYGLNYDASIYRNGQLIPLNKGDNLFIKLRIADLVNSNKASTSEPWFKYEIEKHGDTLQNRWNRVKSGSYLSLNYIDGKTLPNSHLKKFFHAAEVIVEIHENPKDGFFGDVLAIDAADGEIKAYQVDNKKFVSLYCFDRTLPYLPEHYQELSMKYETNEYHDSGISCNLDEDAFLKAKEDKKKKKAAKWNKIRKEKFGINTPPPAE